MNKKEDWQIYLFKIIDNYFVKHELTKLEAELFCITLLMHVSFVSDVPPTEFDEFMDKMKESYKKYIEESDDIEHRES